MRSLILSIFSYGLVTTSALAADAVLYQEPAPAPVLYDSFVWTGFYAGVQGGYAFAGSTYIEYADDDDYDYDLSPRGWFGGIHAGYNHQLGNGLVLGVEGDVNWGRIKASGATSDDYTADVHFNWTGSIRGRAGFAFDRVLTYVTGGVAFGGFRMTEFDDGDLDSDGRTTLTGWTAGIGAEYALTDNWTVRGEYRYTDFGSKSFSTTYDTGTYDWVARPRTHDFRIGASYKF